MSKETTERVARIAAIGIKHPETLTFEEIKALAASCLAQVEDERIDEGNEPDEPAGE
jgi:hypothetical protein